MTDHEKDIEHLKLIIDTLRADIEELRERNTKLLSKLQEYEAREY